jgi:hypothetical protein
MHQQFTFSLSIVAEEALQLEKKMKHLRWVFALLVVGYLVYQFTTDIDRDESGAIVSAGDLDTFSVQVGDCFDDPQQIEPGEASTTGISDVPGLPCSEPHDNEVYAVTPISLDTYPGLEGMQEAATAECVKLFAEFVGTSYQESELDIFTMYPSAESWSQNNDREIICATYRMDGAKLTGTTKGSEL